MPRDPDPKSKDGFQHRTLELGTLARFQSSLNRTPCFGGTCALRMLVAIEKPEKTNSCKQVFWEEDHYLLHCSVGEVIRLPP